MKIAVCDNDICFTSSLEKMLQQRDVSKALRLDIDVFFDGQSLINHICEGNAYDIIFMEIEMKHLNGIQAGRMIRKMDEGVLLIYMSGYECSIKELFEVEPFRFLSKPIDRKQLARYFNEACRKISTFENYYQFLSNKEYGKVPLKNILYFESQLRVINIYLSDGTEEHFYGKLNEVEYDISKSNLRFLRIHQSYLVNYLYIKKMNFSRMVLGWGSGSEVQLKISEDRQKEVRLQLWQLAGKKAAVI